MKKLGSAFAVICGFLTLAMAADAAESEVPEPFQGFDNASVYTINYAALSDLLGTTVVDKGRSNRKVVKPASDITGTRMKAKIKKTANEGNRFYYEGFNDNEERRKLLRDMQTSLMRVPEEIPLEEFSRDEQLAYWLNLYNVTVLNEIIAVYPRRSLKKYHSGRRSIFSEKLLTVAGISLSLHDIQFTILNQNYENNPLIIYGLYQGIIGGPNIRTSAYTAADVYLALEDNAYEFVNSNRGTNGYDENTFRVSSLYGRNRAYFAEFNSDLSEHLLQYLQGSLRPRLAAASKLKPNINDWTVTDMGGTRHDHIGNSLAKNSAAMLDAFKGEQSSFGGVSIAPVMVKRPPREDQREDVVTIDDLGKLPGENQGASVEEITTEKAEPAE